MTEQLKIYEEEFKHFMGITAFPAYELKTKEVSLAVAKSQGFDAAATTFYQPQDDTHTLLISTNIFLPKYLIFHEFTHIFDSEVSAKGDKLRYVGLSGFTEYHASQVELMQLLGANTIWETLSFSMDTIIATMAGEKSVYQYITEKHEHASALFSRPDFPADINTLKSAFGILYNYFGLRSICEMYSVDYVEKQTFESFLKFMPIANFYAINGLMHGWLNEGDIELSINTYTNTLLPLFKEFKFI